MYMCLNYLEVGIPVSKLEIRTLLCCLVILRGVPISHDIHVYPAKARRIQFTCMFAVNCLLKKNRENFIFAKS